MAQKVGSAAGARAHPMHLCEGPKDPTWMASRELHEDKMWARIHMATNLEVKKVPLGVAMEPFCSSNPPSM